MQLLQAGLNLLAALPMLQCGASWAFAAVGALESKLLINTANATGADLDLSEQQILVRTLHLAHWLTSCCIMRAWQPGWHPAWQHEQKP